MTKITSNFKLIAIVLSVTFLLQSCKTYQSKSSTVEDAILSQKQVKVKTADNKSYIFESVQMEGDQLIGVAKRKSKTAKELVSQIITENPDSKFVKIQLPDNFVNEIHLGNNTGKILGWGAGGVVGVIAGGFLLLVLLWAV